MPRVPIVITAQQQNGTIVPSALLAIYEREDDGSLGDLATIYAAEVGSTELDNPASVDPTTGTLVAWADAVSLSVVTTVGGETLSTLPLLTSIPGSAGPAGPTGATGAAGAAGSAGATGATGPAGSTGAKGDKGDTGATGPTGPAGTAGAAGSSGSDGKTVRNGVGAPSSGLGVNGDFYIDTGAEAIYGPKAAGAWGSPVSLVGPTGPTGPAGPTGSAGAAGSDGKTVRSGSGTPSAGLGVDGDFYINTAASTIYGPKASGAWGSPTSLIGPAGATGATGATGSAGSTGATGPTGPMGATGPAGADGAAWNGALLAQELTF